MMNLWRSWLSRIVAAACVNGAIVLSQDVPVTQSARLDALADVTLVVSDVAIENGQSTPSDPDTPKTAVFAYVENQSAYWIGLVCIPPSEALRTQLDLGSDNGLLVEEVIPDGPGMKAGIMKHDLLLSVTASTKQPAEPQVLRSLVDLTNQIQTAMGNPIKVEFLRRGRKQTLELVPVERPNSLSPRLGLKTLGDNVHTLRLTTVPHGPLDQFVLGPMIVQAPPPLPNGMKIEYQPTEGPLEKLTVTKEDQTWVITPSELEKLPEDLRPIVSQHVAVRQHMAHRSAHITHSPAGGYGVRFFNPATTVSPSKALPADVTVTIVRHGADPAAVTVKKGDQSWEATEKDLTKLPAEVRMFVESSLSGNMPPFLSVHGHEAHVGTDAQPNSTPVTRSVIRSRSVPENPASNPTDGKAVAPKGGERWIRLSPTNTESNRQDIERQLKELTEQVAKLREAVEKSQPK